VCLQSPEEIKKEVAKPERCSSHLGQMLDWYCTQCKKLICQSCTENHQEHGVCSLDERIKKIKDSTTGFQEASKKVEERIVHLESFEKSIKKECKTSAEMIQEEFQKVHEQLKQQEEEMAQKISTIENSIKDTVSSHKEQLNHEKMQMAICEKFSSDALIANSAKTLLTYGEWIVTNMDELKEQVEHISFQNFETSVPTYTVQAKFIDNIPFVV